MRRFGAEPDRERALVVQCVTGKDRTGEKLRALQVIQNVFRVTGSGRRDAGMQRNGRAFGPSDCGFGEVLFGLIEALQLCSDPAKSV